MHPQGKSLASPGRRPFEREGCDPPARRTDLAPVFGILPTVRPGSAGDTGPVQGTFMMNACVMGRGTAKENVRRTVQNIGRGRNIGQGWKDHGCYCMNARITTGVRSMQTDLPGAGGDAD
ncbi:hypothetical protein TO66_29945 [Pseudomonas sp. MRSN 12121]|nr:hypothetical protein TO66_29945 [Pseudomonas sp. MRSN 12121]